MLKNKILSASGGGVDPIFVEQVFATHLYTGNGTSQTITNGIDLAGEGGLVWIKNRTSGTTNSHILTDTARGAGANLSSNLTNEQFTGTSNITALGGTGFSVGNTSNVNASTNTYASWTFRKAPKFFDVVTYTGNGLSNRLISHGLGSKPGCIIIKCISASYSWATFHRSINGQLVFLNATTAADTQGILSMSAATETNFTIAAPNATVNESGQTYVAYLFAHDAGGFGESGNDNVISCGSFTTDGSGNATVNLGYEPQWLMFKRSDGTGNWFMLDVMRGWTASASNRNLYANLSDAEAAGGAFSVNSSGFAATSTAANATFIYIAIRRPNKPPTSGTEVFSPNAIVGDSVNGRQFNIGFNSDLYLTKWRSSGTYSMYWFDRLRGGSNSSGVGLASANTNSESGNQSELGFYGWATTTANNANNVTLYNGSSGNRISNISDTLGLAFRRAPGFFDVVCYTGNSNTSQTLPHNLTVQPEMFIVKSRSTTFGWFVYHKELTATSAVELQKIDASSTWVGWWNNTEPTETNFTVAYANSNPQTYVAYLFATLPGISKVGSYTGNGTNQTIDCGFTTGARFFLVKATSTTGWWWVYDSARGIVSAADPALRLNSTAAEVTSADAVDPTATGIIVNQEATCSINASGVSYIFLAIA